MTDYSVQTDVYNGPLDLLLYLIRREEVDIQDIPIARLTEQYCQHVAMLAVIDPNVAGDFLVLAATLMEIKSRMLLPRQAVEGDEGEDFSDPRLELVRQLLEYKKFKDASFDLGAAAQLRAMRWERGPTELPGKPADAVDLEDVQLWDLVSTFNRLLASIGAGSASHDVVFDDTPIAAHARDLVMRLQETGGTLAFESIFEGRGRSEMIGLFLALLELIRQSRVRITQEALFGPIHVVLLSAEPIEVGDEWGPHRPAASRIDALAEPRSSDSPRAVEADAPDDETESFEELDRIKTDVDIDSILRQGGARRDEPEGSA
jgi:segregation and condensation protein A